MTDTDTAPAYPASLTAGEILDTRRLLRRLLSSMPPDALPQRLRRDLWRLSLTRPARTSHGLPALALRLDMALTFADEVDADPAMTIAILLCGALRAGMADDAALAGGADADTLALARKMAEVEGFAASHAMADQENYSGLLLTLSGDVRVVIALIVRSLALMRRINMHPDAAWVAQVAGEALALYSRLAHRLGLYGVKSVLEDLWLKYTHRDVYKEIASRLNQTKRARDAYIARFIGPVEERLAAAGLSFTIKGRTKSIYSIWNKIVGKKVDMDHIYDLFAIRVIIDAEGEREKADCWLGYSIVGNMYPPDPSRMRDWLSFPKENGYESLHITVLGPERKWVEVQFRSRRMDLVAEKGLAAHWRYKGGRAASTDLWMARVRDMLERPGAGGMERVGGVAPGEDEREVYAFTPKGDLLRLPPGSTLLDFAFAIHTAVGCRCTGGTVNGRHEGLATPLRSGDVVSVQTSAQQVPRHEWLRMVRTSKARAKIRQSLDEARRVKASLGREMLERRLRNRKMETDEATLSRLMARQGYRTSTDFLADVADEKVDLASFLDLLREAESASSAPPAAVSSADEFVLQRHDDGERPGAEPLVIGSGAVKGLRYETARCCDPLPGDPVFGFISADGRVKVHRDDCPNAAHIRGRYPYRVIPVRWSGDGGGARPATLRVVGRDDIGIVTNITALIDREPGVRLTGVQITSADGLFTGLLTLHIDSPARLKGLLRRLTGVKGVRRADVV